MVLQKADESNKSVEIIKVLCEAAFEALLSGDTQKHDDLMLTEIEKISEKVDVIIFAQGSMSRLLSEAQKIVSTPVLECIDSGIKQVKEHFDLTEKP